ncbi:Pkinase-domain-containing protein [Obba rivulosa]|uniref:Pkinase-domain-containing protein n=1 Tax=Obba rivulosa TaxID=1052685 RepID=A0A8E2DET2_9APHY|nr:Pkinase-domain-containing protein [Obba rivulosa]
MVTTPKRSASTSPNDSRPNKRHAPSSPEEGELDDATPPQPKPARSPTPVKTTSKPAPKVPFPFKKKIYAAEEKAPPPPNGLTKSREQPMVYERSEEDERRFRQEEERKYNYSRPRPPPPPPPPPHGIDRWQPAAGRYDYGTSWNHTDPRSSYHYPRERDVHDDRRYRPISPRHDRRSASRSPSSHRSRSPVSPPPNKEKHRLPPSRSSAAPPPLGDYYDDRGGRDRHRRSPDRAYDRSRQVWRDGYVDDRYYRPRDPSRDSRDDRRWERPRRSTSPARHYDARYDADTYRPTSPRQHTPPRPLSPRSPARLSERPRSREPLPPRPPSVPPPPPPPEIMKESVLPTEHTVIKIPLPKKPPTPVNLHSPPSMPVPPPKTGTIPHAPESRERLRANGSVEPPVAHRHRRRATLRPREEEERLYGRLFLGCGRQDDYDVLTKLGEGTFGEVHKAVHRTKGNAVALKRILMHNEKEGMPVTALREIKILKALHHPCVVEILDMFVVRSQGKDAPLSVYMVFPYMDHDLAGLLENERVKLTPSQIKLYMKQLLEGTEYMHRNHIIHRDMKAANLLISNTGSLKIADFGLARAFDPNITRGGGEDFRGRERKYTNCVVTRWYRPPELLLGARQYGGEIDMWGIGCVLGEMFWRRPILPGTTDVDQLEKIWQLCGTPNQHTWPNHDQLPGCEGVKRFNQYPRRVKQVYEMIGVETCDLLDKLLVCNPRDRLTASQALDHDYFWTDPLPADPKTLPSYEASHEFDKRGRRNQAPAGPPIPGPHMDGPPRQLPMPITQPPMPYGRPPPPREAFRNGPRPSFPPGPPPGLHPSSYRPYPPPPGGYPPPGQHPQRFPVPGAGFPPGPPPPLPVISLRPGQPPPQIAPLPWQQQPPHGRPAHLPARPHPMPLQTGRGPPLHSGEHQRRDPGNGGAGDLNYG